MDGKNYLYKTCHYNSMIVQMYTFVTCKIYICNSSSGCGHKNVVIHYTTNETHLEEARWLTRTRSLYLLHHRRYACGLCLTWWRHKMETFSAFLVLCAGNSPVTGEFPAQRPVTRSFAGFFDLRLNKRLSKQSWGWWFESPSWSLWRHCNECVFCYGIVPVEFAHALQGHVIGIKAIL